MHLSRGTSATWEFGRGLWSARAAGLNPGSSEANWEGPLGPLFAVRRSGAEGVHVQALGVSSGNAEQLAKRSGCVSQLHYGGRARKWSRKPEGFNKKPELAARAFCNRGARPRGSTSRRPRDVTGGRVTSPWGQESWWRAEKGFPECVPILKLCR